MDTDEQEHLHHNAETAPLSQTARWPAGYNHRLLAWRRALGFRFVFAWHDLWVGVFVDHRKHRVYVFPLPCLGFVVSWVPRFDG